MEPTRDPHASDTPEEPTGSPQESGGAPQGSAGTPEEPASTPQESSGTPPPPAPTPPPQTSLPESSADAGATEAPDKPDAVKRFLAKFIDGIIAAVLFWIISAIIPGLTLGFLVGGLVAAAYWLVCDGLDLDFMKQRSLGKKIIGLKPVRLDGQPMNIETSAKRNWMFTIGYFYQLFAFGLSYSLASLVSLITLVIIIYDIYKMFSDKATNRRWGDELAGTRVVTAS